MLKAIIGLVGFSIIACNIVAIHGCWEKFKNSESIVNASDICTVKLNLTEDDFPKGLEEWKSNTFDDKCHSRCIMTEMNQIAPDKSISLPAVIKNIEDNAPFVLSTKAKLIELVKECYTDYEKQKQATGKPDDCKVMKNFMMCHFLHSETFC